jgi:very-long-chain ceramide synthase
MGFGLVCDIMFGIFMVSWFLARHVFYCTVCYSIWAHTPTIMPTGCFKSINGKLIGPTKPPTDSLSYLWEPFVRSDGVVCYDEKVKWIFLSTLLALQCITLVWFWMIIQVAKRVLSGEGAGDSRSDDEEEEEEEAEDEEEFVYEMGEPLEEDVGVEGLDLKNWERRAGVKRQASSSGVTLPGHSDRKELLNRIGCEKQID